MTITFCADTNKDANAYYNNIIISNIAEEKESFVKVKEYLGLIICLPVSIKSTDIRLNKWDQNCDAVLVSQEKQAANAYIVKIKISSKDSKPLIMTSNDSLTIELSSSGNPDVSDLEFYLNTIAFAKETYENICGELLIKVIEPFSPQLNDLNAPIYLENDIGITYIHDISVNAKKIPVVPGTYLLSTKKESMNKEGTATSFPVFKFDRYWQVEHEVTIEKNVTNTVEATFDIATLYSSASIKFESLDELKYANFHALATINGKLFNKFLLSYNNTRFLPKLPLNGLLEVSFYPIIINNKLYTASKAIDLKGKHVDLTFTENDFIINTVDDKEFIPVTLSIDSEYNFSGKFQLLQLINDNEDTTYYTMVELKNNDKINIPFKIRPGTYRVSYPNFVKDKTAYAITGSKNITISETYNHIKLGIQKGAKLTVRGFEDELGFGGCATLESDNITYFTKSKTSSIFKYAGVGGDGDPSTVLKSDESTKKTIELAREIEKNTEKKVLPVMISYTVQLSGGEIDVLLDEKKLTNSFANYMLTLLTLSESADEEHSIAGGIIVNPDMLGSLLQHDIKPTNKMPVKLTLAKAIAARKNILPKDIKIPNDITDDIKGYIHAVNWLTCTLAPNVTFAWQINLWGIDGGGSEWIYDKDPDTKASAECILELLNDFEVYSGEYKPDFLAVDRYEADDFTVRSYVNKFCYGPKEWNAYFDFCNELSLASKLPIMPWQIPASRTPVTTDMVNDDFENQHWGTAGTYIFGDEFLANNTENIHPTIRNFSFTDHKASAIAAIVGDTPELLYKRKKLFDVSKPAYTNFPSKGIFHIQLGGGSTVGMVPPTGGREADLSWVNDKLEAYAKNPVTFEDTI